LFIYLIPIFSSLIGWFTNFIAVKMLFHPQKPIDFKLFKIQGIFPKRQAQIAEKLGTIVATELLSSSDLSQQILKEDNLDKFYGKVEKHIVEYIRVQLPKKFSIFSVLITEKLKMKIVSEVMQQIKAKGPSVFNLFLNDLENNLDIGGMINKKVSAFDSNRLEQLLKSLMKQEFKFIEWIGAILGFLIGCLQLLLLYFQGALPPF